MTLDDQKAQARKAAYAARKIAHGQGHDAAANAALLELSIVQAAPVIAGYMPIRTEISPLAAMTALHQAGRQIAVPVIIAPGEALAFHRWTPDCALFDGPFGAQVPATPEPLIPDLLITPMVAFDAERTRLGYGGGFYDRSLTQLRQEKPAHAIGFAYAAQQLPTLPKGQYDVPLDQIVTENGLL